MLTLQALTDIEGNNRTSGSIWNPDFLERVLNRIALPNSTVGKCALMQVIKQPQHVRTSTTKDQK